MNVGSYFVGDNFLMLWEGEGGSDGKATLSKVATSYVDYITT
jgi:hypothetical protein